MTYTLEIQYLTPREMTVGGQSSRSGFTDYGLINMVRLRVARQDAQGPVIASRISVLRKNDYSGIATIEVRTTRGIEPVLDEWRALKLDPPIIGCLLAYRRGD